MKTKREIVVATGNRNKLAELRTIGDRFGLTLLSPAEAQSTFSLGPIPEVEENGATFAANALLKAEAFQRWSGRAALGDDSGIEIDALGGAPGVFSARYAGPGANDSERISKLVFELDRALEKNPAAGRTGRFRCSLALKLSDGSLFESDGSLEGTVLAEPRGTHGFGYDPILLISEFGKTLAEVDFQFTCEQGFRARAAEKLFGALTKTA